jgi:hypothetical protein
MAIIEKEPTLTFIYIVYLVDIRLIIDDCRSAWMIYGKNIKQEATK